MRTFRAQNAGFPTIWNTRFAPVLLPGDRGPGGPGHSHEVSRTASPRPTEEAHAHAHLLLLLLLRVAFFALSH